MIKKILEYIFAECINCNSDISSFDSLCDNCNLQLYRFKGCFKCISNCLCNYQSVIPFRYKSIIKSLILRFKYNKEYSLAKFFSKYMINQLKHIENPVIIIIPIHKKKLESRTYNQSLVLASEIKPHLNAFIDYFTFKLNSNYTSKKNKNFKQRQVQSIELNDITNIINQNVIIIDDVIASGSTISQCINLIEKYVKSITICAIAKT